MISTSQVEIIKEKVTFNKPIPEGFFAWCKCTINRNIVREIVTDGSEEDVIRKCKRNLPSKTRIEKIEVLVVKVDKKN